MIDKTNKTNDGRLRYRSPKINVIEVKAQNVLCLSEDYSTSTDAEEDQLP